jgi:hypothetical protein
VQSRRENMQLHVSSDADRDWQMTLRGSDWQ